MQVDKSLITSIIEAAMSADYTALRRFGGQVAKHMADQGDPEGAKALQTLLRKRGVPLQASGYAEALPRDSESRLPLIEEVQWPTTPIMLGEEAGQTISQFIEDARHIGLLAEKGVSARLGLLLYGPPGTGKNLLAGHIAASLRRPHYIARLDALISSKLGVTAKNVRGIFEFVPARNAVLFLDEMDAIAKLRDDRHELGELKRVVNTVLQGLDSLTDDVVTVGATNHPQLLDPAIWRRFPYKVELDLPDEDVRASMWEHFLFQGDDAHGGTARLLARVSDGLSGADIENTALAARRRAILSNQEPNLAQILLAVGASRTGSARLLDNRELVTAERRTLTRLLHEKGGISQSEIGGIVGVSRQMVHRYLRESLDG
ncbi:MAG: ATP-binding protein [Boseongicola sp. SB0676_bin_33]|uniref:ATP-binding protein n=1 Tax=Boseongicola sp. SB0664_bin_43 TaxID=2604844 RepID=A0A6B0Y1Y0_9RHOB|nr:ATP-binding protein [Boseongicola sp. SB0664_bin_43]MYF89259.1 ATP-binding protein [Boseongicola sp. SB0676_bin_33]